MAEILAGDRQLIDAHFYLLTQFGLVCGAHLKSTHAAAVVKECVPLHRGTEDSVISQVHCLALVEAVGLLHGVRHYLQLLRKLYLETVSQHRLRVVKHNIHSRRLSHVDCEIRDVQLHLSLSRGAAEQRAEQGQQRSNPSFYLLFHCICFSFKNTISLFREPGATVLCCGPRVRTGLFTYCGGIPS